MAITLVQAQTQLSNWLAASTAVSASQNYKIATEGGSRELTRANASEIQEMITYWERRVDALTPDAQPVRTVYINHSKGL